MSNMNENNIYEKLQTIEIKLTRIEDKLETKTNQILKLECEIFGNGRKGIKDKIQDIEKFQAKVIGMAIAGTFIANYLFEYLKNK